MAWQCADLGVAMSGGSQRPADADIEFMRSLEDEFKALTGVQDRSQFKIFYCPVWRAPVMVLGINPGGDPATIAPDGVHYRDGSNRRAASSMGHCENGEHDLLDCTWDENTGLLKLLIPILGSSPAIRRGVVKTNLAFLRSRNAKDRRAIERSKDESAPFLRRILDRVLPDLILLTGVKLHDFGNRHCAEVVEIAQRQEVASVHQTVIFPARVRFLGGHSCIAVEVAHASQWNWIYNTYAVPSKIKTLLSDQNIWLCGPVDSIPAPEAQLSTSSSQPRPDDVLRRYRAMAAARTSTGSKRGAGSSGIGSEDTKRILRELKRLGLDEYTYQKYLHHRGHSMAKMFGYVAREYAPGSPNLILHQKLDWMLRVCRERQEQPDSTDVLRKLAIETTNQGWEPDRAAPPL